MYIAIFINSSTGLRFTVYGPWGRPDMALFKFTKAITEGKILRYLIMVNTQEILPTLTILLMV